MLDKLTDDILKKKNKDELREICASFGRTRCKSFTKKRLNDIILENQ